MFVCSPPAAESPTNCRLPETWRKGRLVGIGAAGLINGQQEKVRLVFEFGFAQQATGAGSWKHTSSVSSLVSVWYWVGCEERNPRKTVCVSIWRGSGHASPASRPEQLVSFSESPRGKGLTKSFKLRNPTTQPGLTHSPATQRCNPQSLKFQPLALGLYMEPIPLPSSGFTRASASIAQAS